MSSSINRILIGIWDTIFDAIIVLKITLPCAFLGFFNKTFFSYLPCAICLDLLVFYVCLILINYRQFKQLKSVLIQYSISGYSLHPLSDRRYEEINNLWKAFSKVLSGSHISGVFNEITIIQVDSKSLMDGLICIPFSYQQSVVFIPKEFDVDDPLCISRLFHEFSHCILHHDENVNIKIHASAIVYGLLSMTFGFCFFSITTILLGIILFIITRNSTNIIFQEIEANQQSLSIIENKYGDGVSKTAAQMFFVNCNDELQKYFEEINDNKEPSHNRRERRYEYYYNLFQIVILENYLDKDMLIDYYNDVVNQYNKNENGYFQRWILQTYKKRLDTIRKRGKEGAEIITRPYTRYSVFIILLMIVSISFYLYNSITIGFSRFWLGFGIFIILYIVLTIVNFTICKKKALTILSLGMK